MTTSAAVVPLLPTNAEAISLSLLRRRDHCSPDAPMTALQKITEAKPAFSSKAWKLLDLNDVELRSRVAAYVMKWNVVVDRRTLCLKTDIEGDGSYYPKPLTFDPLSYEDHWLTVYSRMERDGRLAVYESRMSMILECYPETKRERARCVAAVLSY